MLREELEHHRAEKDRLRQIVGQIGGQPSLRRTRWFNAAILVLVVLEIAIFLLSLKIVWMIHLPMKLHHFPFWILNSLDFPVNDLSRRLRDLERPPARQGRSDRAQHRHVVPPAQIRAAALEPPRVPPGW